MSQARIDARELLSSALSMWWLRPENGLAVAAYCLYGVEISPGEGKRSADFACGDGANTFFKCGGRFDESFDLFGVSVLDRNINQVVEEKQDVFDHFEPDYHPKISTRPRHTYTFGLDHKENLLKKAERLEFYTHTILSDLEKDSGLDDESLDLVYCNSLYWVPNPERACNHIFRKLIPGGQAIFEVMTSDRAKLQFQNLYPSLPPHWTALMNRGREHNNPGLRSESEWRDIFGQVGKIEQERVIFPAGIAKFWNFGLRPLFPVLNRMAAAIREEKKMPLKREWVDTWTQILLPLLLDPSAFSQDDLRVRLQYVVRKT